MAKINRKDLLTVCKTVMSGVAIRELIPQSSCFVFKEGNVYTFNDEIAVNCPIEAGFEGAVPAKEFLAFINKVKAETISLSISNNELIMAGSKAKAGLRLEQTLTLSLADIGKPEEWIELPSPFNKAMGVCLFSASKDATKEILMNIHVNGQFIESSDNYRFSRYDMGKAAAKSFPDNLLIPASAAKEIIGHEPTEYAVTPGWLHFRNADNVTFSCRTVTEDYPDFTPFLECEGDELEFPESLSEIMDRANILSDGERISIILEEDFLTVTTENQAGWFEESIETKYKGEDTEFEIQPDFMKALLQYKGVATIGDKMLMFKSSAFTHCVMLLTPKKK
jgi:DNA polymerase III sliding clamp (beta) subunit (PCNA family)